MQPRLSLRNFNLNNCTVEACVIRKAVKKSLCACAASALLRLFNIAADSGEAELQIPQKGMLKEAEVAARTTEAGRQFRAAREAESERQESLTETGMEARLARREG